MNGERVRLFVALELPEEIRAALIRWRGAVLRELSGLRPVATDALHVTLCFIGSRPVSEVEQIGAACAALAVQPRARLSVASALWLPARRPRVLAVGLEDPEGALAETQAELSRKLQSGGWYVPEARPFLAHVTVARAERGARVRPAELPEPPRLALEGAVITLYRSRLGRGGATYEPLETVELGSSSDLPVDPIAVVRRFHAEQARAYAGSELDRLCELLTDDVVWHVPGRSAIAGEHRGVDAVLAYFARRTAMSDATFRVTVHGAAIIGDRVVQLAGGSAERGGRPVTWETVGVFRVARGRIAECWLVPFDLDAFDEIWS